LGCEAQAGCKTRTEKDQCSSHYERSLKKKDGRGSAETVGCTEESGEGVIVLPAQ
jgi:hypothetical protein